MASCRGTAIADFLAAGSPPRCPPKARACDVQPVPLGTPTSLAPGTASPTSRVADPPSPTWDPWSAMTTQRPCSRVEDRRAPVPRQHDSASCAVEPQAPDMHRESLRWLEMVVVRDEASPTWATVRRWPSLHAPTDGVRRAFDAKLETKLVRNSVFTQLGFSRLMRLLSSMCSRGIRGRPTLFVLDFHRHKSRKRLPIRCAEGCRLNVACTCFGRARGGFPAARQSAISAPRQEATPKPLLRHGIASRRSPATLSRRVETTVTCVRAS